MFKLSLERLVGVSPEDMGEGEEVWLGRSAREKAAWRKDTPGESYGPGEGGVIFGTGGREIRKKQRQDEQVMGTWSSTPGVENT